MVNKRYALFIILCLGIISSYANATATAQLDRTSISINETVQLSITLDESSMFSGPDTSALENDFNVLGSNKSSQSSWINGKKSANTTWIYELAPKQAGIFTIPAIDVDGQLTQPISIHVKPADTNPDNRAGVEPTFMEVFTDKESVYVQEQLLLTIRINSSVSLSDPQLHEFQIDNAITKQLNSTRYNRNINGIPHITYEILYSVFPQTSGDLNIPAITASGIAPLQRSARGYGSIFNQGKTLRMRGNPLSITVKEVPDTFNSNNWLPAKNLQLQESWSNDPTEVHLGDSITRTITTTAIGLSGEQIPPIEIKSDTTFKSYPDQAVFEDQYNEQGIIGVRKDAIALVATKPGKITLPEINIEWWDISSNTLKTATLPKITLNVIGTSSQSTPIQTPAPQSMPIPENTVGTEPIPTTTNNNAVQLLMIWQAATAVASALALIFLILFIHARKNSLPAEPAIEEQPKTSSTDIHLQELKSACSGRDTQSIRTALLRWAQLTWPNVTLHSTVDVARQFNDSNFDLRMKKLDAILFSGDESIENWQGLYEQVAEKHQQLNTNNKQKLAPLYPAQ